MLNHYTISTFFRNKKINIFNEQACLIYQNFLFQSMKANDLIHFIFNLKKIIFKLFKIGVEMYASILYNE